MTLAGKDLSLWRAYTGRTLRTGAVPLRDRNAGEMIVVQSKFAAWWMVVVLFMAAIFSFLDRGIIGLVVDPIRRDLQISEFQVSLLQGLSFGIFYATVGLFLGLGADRWPRRLLLMGGIAAWSLATMMCGLSHNFLTLFLWRLIVGAGEATLIPVSISLIGDMFAPTRRGAPLSLFFLGTSVAAGLSVTITGFLLAQIPNGLFADIPGLAVLSPWRAVFVVCGGAGFLLVPLLLTTVEPKRQAIESGAPRAGLLSTARYFHANWRVFAPLYFGFALITAGQYGVGAWAPSMLIRHFGVGVAQVGKILGPLSMIAALLSTLSAAFVVDTVSRRYGRDAKLLVLSLAAIVALPCAFAVFMPTLSSAALVLAWMSAVYPFASICFAAVVQDLTPGNMRGVAMAAALFANTLIASTAGTMMIAVATQYVFKNDALVGFGILTVLLPAFLGAFALLVNAYLTSRARASGTPV